MKTNYFKYVLMLIALFLMTGMPLKAENTTEIFEQANKLYQEGDFQQAAELYSSLIEEDYYSEELFYNLGSTYYRLNRHAEAILYYEKALKLNPNESNYLHNLAIVNSKINSDTEKNPEFFLNKWWGNLTSFASASGWSVLALFLFWTGIAGGLIWLFANKRRHKKLGFFLGTILVFASILPFLMANGRANTLSSSKAGIIMESGITLKAAPESDVVVEEMKAGTKVKLVDVIGEWEKVELPNGEIGWLHRDNIGKI